MGSCGESAMVNDDLSGEPVIEQHSCSEIPVQSDPLLQKSCSEGACNALESDAVLCGVKGGCVDLPQEGRVGSASDVDVADRCGDALASQCEKANQISEDDCQNSSGMCCGNVEDVQDASNLSILPESVTLNGLQEHCVQQGEQKDDKINEFPSVGDDSAVMEGKTDEGGLFVDAFNSVPDFRHSEVSLESEPMTDVLVDCNQKNEQQDIMRNAEPLSKVVECDDFRGTEAHACRKLSSSLAMEVPSSTMCTELESRSDQLSVLKYGEDLNNTFEEKNKDFVDKESIIDSYVQVLASPGFHRTTLGSSPVLDSPPEPSVLDPGNLMENGILQIEDNLCKLKARYSEETASCASRKPVIPESGQPSVVLTTISYSEDVPDLLPKGDDVSVNNSSAVDTAAQTDNDGKGIVEADCFTESILLPSQRNSRRTKVDRKTQTRIASRKCKSKAGVTHPGRGMKVDIELARKRRSCSSKPARSSTWGLLGNIERFFELDNQPGVSKVMSQELGRTRSKRQTGKVFKNSANSSSLNSVQKCPVPTTRVRLKIKFGKEIDSSSSNVLIPETVNGLASDLRTGSGSQKVASNVGDKISEVVASDNLEFKNTLEKDALVLNGQIAISHLESAAITEKSDGGVEGQWPAVPSEKVVEPLIEPINNKDMDPGTSPDSEVINSLPEVQVGERHQEGVHHAISGPSSEFNSVLDVTISNRGKKKDKLICSSNSITEDGSHGPQRNNRAKHSKNHRRKQNFRDAVSCLELPASTEINPSGKSISSKELSTEPLPLSGEIEFGDSAEALKVQSHIEVKETCKPSVDHGFSESQGFENLPSSARYLGRKLPKSLSMCKVSKAKCKASDSTGRKKTTVIHKEKQKKPINKSEVKEKGVFHKDTCEVEDRPDIAASTVGNHKLDAVGKINVGDNRVSVNVPNLDLVPSIDSGEQHLSPRNAWVRCDDCHKWRRIPAALADRIDETNCTWTCKDSNDKAFADCAIPQEKSNAEINAELGLSYSSGEEDAYEGSKKYKELEYQLPLVSQESSFTRIFTNEFLHRSRRTQTIDEIMVCHCKRPQEGKSGCSDECLNRMLNIECVQGTCPCGDHCSNQQFQNRKYATLRWFRCGKKGYGLKALEGIAKGQFLIEYVGEVLDMHAYEARQREYALKGHRHFYFMTLNGSEVIDASAKGNMGRFINHSCDPNCRTEKWMVNGEICIGLFALRDIKQDEEVTFDYNYVRVFGAAAKKCHCGSVNCRGYIGGGDPLDDEVIVQAESDDEFPEPVMLTDDSEIEESVPIPQCSDNVDRQSTRHIKERVVLKKSTAAIDSNGTPDKESSMNPASAVSPLHGSVQEDSKGKLPSSVQVEEISQVQDATSKTMPAVQQGCAMELDLTDKTSSTQRAETTSSLAIVSNVLLNSAGSNRESKSAIVEGRLVKTPQLNGFVKKGKVRANPPNGFKAEATVNRLPVSSSKLKKVVEGSSNGRFEAVQGKLSELLDGDGGISKRKDATKGYLKLLLLTVASGDRSNGEAIQSNRDLSMILDALLKTKSKAVLNDIINKNGLQMLHKIMKQYRQDFKKIPILRKLLKVLEFLAASKILTSEHINRGPPCHGMESFRESMLSLTEHDDKQVHQIARSFRDRWIPRSGRRHGYMDRDDNRVESHRSFNNNRFSSPHNLRHEQDSRSGSAEAIDSVQKSMFVTTSVDTGTPERSSAPSLDGVEIKERKKRKRKSRWDQPAETNSIDESQNNHEDVPPGFSCPIGSLSAPLMSGDHALHNANHSGFPSDFVTGQPKEKFNSRLPVSYGMPWSVVKQYGTPHAEIAGSWITAPGMPFNPFPPLPPYPRDEKDRLPSDTTIAMAIDKPAEVKPCDTGGLVNSSSDDMICSTTGANPEDINLTSDDDKHNPKRLKDDSYDLGKKYFRQQKWNNSKIHRPWFRRNALNSNRSNTSGDVCSIGGVGNIPKEAEVTCSEDAVCRDEKGGNNIY